MKILEQLRYYLPIILRGWWILALSTLLAITLSLFSAYTATPKYQTSATLRMVPNTQLERDADRLKALEIFEERVLAATHVEILKSSSLLERIKPTLPIPAEKLETIGKYSVNAVVLPETSIIEVFVEGPDPAIARELANGLAYQSTFDFEQQYGLMYHLQLLDKAETPTVPVSPTPTRDAPLAGFLGLAIGVALVVAYDQLAQLLFKRPSTQATAAPVVSSGELDIPEPVVYNNGTPQPHDAKTPLTNA